MPHDTAFALCKCKHVVGHAGNISQTKCKTNLGGGGEVRRVCLSFVDMSGVLVTHFVLAALLCIDSVM